MRLHACALLLLFASCKKSNDSGFGPATPPTSITPVAIAGDDFKVVSGYSTGFESMGGWTLDPLVSGVGWGIDGSPASMPGGAVRSGLASLNYNSISGTFDNGLPNTGKATSPSINVAGVFGATLVFWCNYQTDTTGGATDTRRLQVSNTSFTTTLVDDQLTTSGPTPQAGACSAMGVWHLHTLALTPAWGSIQVRFVFDSVDSSNNAFGGWFIDDLSILSDYSWGFESDGAWTFDAAVAGVGWAVDMTPASVAGGSVAHSGAKSLNYNNSTDYANGAANSGSATSPVLNLAGLTGANLRFWCNYQTDTTGTSTDKRWVRISNNGFVSNLVSQQLAGTATAPYQCAAMGTWHTHTIPLDPSWGSSVQVRFFFDSVNSTSNSFAGWFIDDLSIAILLSGKKSSDPSGAALTYLWEQTGGNPVTIDSPTDAETTITYPSLPGTSTFRLTVTGPNGSDSDTVDASFKPVVVSAPDTWFTGYEKAGTVTATASGRTPSFTYQWSGVEPWLSVTGASTSALGFTTPKLSDFQNFPDIAGVAVLQRSAQGRLQLKVTATDADGNTDEDYVNFSAGPFADPVANENVAFGEPVFLNGAATPSTWTWTGTKPSGASLSFFKPDKTAMVDNLQRFVYIVPDQVGPYEIILTQTPGPVVKVINLTCGKYVGVGTLTGLTPDPFKGECAACHGGQLGFLADFANPWKETGHAHMFERILDPSNPFYSPSQAKGRWIDAFNFGSNFSIDSRTVGWSAITAGAHNGWVEKATAEGYVFKGSSWSELVRKFPLTAAKSNVQCESCHGPGSEHAGDTTGIRKSFDASVCGRCHSDKADVWETAGHADRASAAFTSASGNATCNGCHTAQGFVVEMRAQEGADPHPVLFGVSNLNRPVIPLEDRQPQTCQTCHEPHKRTVGMNNPTGPDPQLRAFGNVQFRNGATWDAGRAAVCAMCHQSRTDTRANSADINVRRAPHDSTAAEMLAGTNAQQFSGWTYANSPHAIASRFIVPGGTENRQCLSCHSDVQPGKGALGYNGLGGHTFHMTQGDNTVIASNATHTGATADATTNALNVSAGPSFLKKVFTGDTVVLDGVPNTVSSVDGARQVTLLNAPAGGVVTTWSLTSVKKYNVAACNQCHGTMALDFRGAARGDYDGDGSVDSVQVEIEGSLAFPTKGLLPKLLSAINTKLASLTGGANTLLIDGGRIKYTNGSVKRTFPGPNVSASDQPIAWSTLSPTLQADWLALYQAAYNYTFVKNDQSGGIHNTGYAVNLLQSSYKAVTGVAIGVPYVPFP